MISFVLILLGSLALVISIAPLWLLSFVSVLNVPGIWKMFLCWRFDSMYGYRILFLCPDGSKDTTFFGIPFSSFPLNDLSTVEIVHFMFSLAHPGCVILDIQLDVC